MSADTPRDRRGRGAPLLRATDHARRLLRRAQFALAGVAVVVSVTVGIVAGTDPPPGVASGPVGVEQMSLVGPPPAGSRPEADDERAVLGLSAGLATLTVCWLILVAVGPVWRRRLDERDLRDWAESWARVEPLWRDRPF